jgi:copper chaperone CopZ
VITATKIALTVSASVALVSIALLGSSNDGGVRAVRAQALGVAAHAPDTTTVRLHISRMTCGSCPTTARLALERLPGVHEATVTLEDSLGVVRYDPRRVTPDQIAAHLTRLTGFGATVLPNRTASGKPGGE